MEMDNSNDEDKLQASTSLPQRSEEEGCNLLTNDSANVDGVASGCQHNDNVPPISQSHNREIAPSGGNLMTNFSQINDPSNFDMRHYLHEGDHQSLLHRSNSGFLFQQAPFNLNSSEMLDSSRMLMFSPNQVAKCPLDFDFGMPMFSPNQGAVLWNSPEKFEESHLTSNSGSNTNAEINTRLFGTNLDDESRRGFVPTFSSNHSKMDNRRFPYPAFDVNGAISGSQNNNEFVYDLPQNAAWMHSTGNHNLRPAIRLGPPSLPSGSNQITRCDIRQSRANEHTVFSSPGMASSQPLSGQLPGFNVNSNGMFSLQSSTSPPLGLATGRNSWIDPSNIQNMRMREMIVQGSRPCVRPSLKKRVASEPQSSVTQARQRKTLMNRQLIPPSVPTWTGSTPLMPNTTQTMFRSSHKAIPLPPQATSSTVRPPISTLSAPNTSQTSPPLVRAAPFPPAQACADIPRPYYDKRMPYFHPGSTQIISPPHQPQMTHSPPHPIISPPHQPQMTQSLPRPRSRPPPIMPSARKVFPSLYIKRQDEGPKLIGHNCCLCKRDLSFAPEGPISQPFPAPVSAVLPCGHTFHQECLDKITPEDLSSEPPCIPCALGE